MNVAFLLDKNETSKFGEKDSVTYKALIAFLREVKDRLGIEIVVVGTKKTGELFKFDISRKSVEEVSTESWEVEEGEVAQVPAEVDGVLGRMRNLLIRA